MKKHDHYAIAIVAAKENSKRFPGKNEYRLDGTPMFFHSVKPLLDSREIDKVYVATNSSKIAAFARSKGVEVIPRRKNAIEDEEPLISVLKAAYMQLDVSAEYICTIMANCPGHSAETVDRAVALTREIKINEVRSFNAKGDESGIIILKESVLMKASMISSHLGMVRSDVTEIHYKKDIKEYRPVGRGAKKEARK